MLRVLEMFLQKITKSSSNKKEGTGYFVTLFLCILFSMFVVHKAAAESNNTAGTGKALEIRYTGFPRKDIRAVDVIAGKSYLEKRLEEQTKKTLDEKQKSSKQEQDVFKDEKIKKEFDSYKQRQLEAIKSDNETLINLHKAIQTLNAEKELDFMDPSRNIEKVEDKP